VLKCNVIDNLAPFFDIAHDSMMKDIVFINCRRLAQPEPYKEHPHPGCGYPGSPQTDEPHPLA
jgi:hypothetical protein